MAEHLVEKEKAKAEAAAKLKSAAEKEKRALHSFYFLHSLFTLNDAKNSINIRPDKHQGGFIRQGIQGQGQGRSSA
jgi:hypothetical protein